MTNVQNQPGATNSSQSQQIAPADPQAATAIADQLGQLLEQERGRISAIDQCVGFLDVADQQNLDEPDGRVLAKGMLTRIGELCSGAPAVLQLVTSTLNLIAALHKAVG
ncbi:hypothetical protein P3T36_002069 [Kitasatospora sp. MAP12-15]|uniref:hypothetical protein n=1 Tax=unclassified Kitasatospora TaxID=2633591 RepID=UPI0024731C2C|nr:hypothetical protein [Kitasatospora sp. MAP12-44]MDH6111755.1 hypothetical protein [Kitasatospora sp. MAP12-44]